MLRGAPLDEVRDDARRVLLVPAMDAYQLDLGRAALSDQGADGVVVRRRRRAPRLVRHPWPPPIGQPLGHQPRYPALLDQRGAFQHGLALALADRVLAMGWRMTRQ